MKNAFCCILKAFIVLKILKSFCPELFGHLGKWTYKKASVCFKIFDVVNWETNNCNLHIAKNFKE